MNAPSRRKPVAFGAVKHSGIDNDAPAPASPAKRAADAAKAGGAVDLSTRWSDETMALAKKAHIIDRILEPGSTPRAFNGWVVIAVQMWARLSPQRRAQERARLTWPAATKDGSRPRKFTLPEAANTAMDDAIRADELKGHLQGRGTFVTYAVLYAAASAASRNGGTLELDE